jgi:hypothetical protein
MDIVTMSPYRDKFVDIIKSLLAKYIDKCRQKISDVIGDSTETGARLQNPEFLQLLRSDPLWKSLKSVLALSPAAPTNSSNKGSSVGSHVHSLTLSIHSHSLTLY